MLRTAQQGFRDRFAARCPASQVGPTRRVQDQGKNRLALIDRFRCHPPSHKTNRQTTLPRSSCHGSAEQYHQRHHSLLGAALVHAHHAIAADCDRYSLINAAKPQTLSRKSARILHDDTESDDGTVSTDSTDSHQNAARRREGLQRLGHGRSNRVSLSSAPRVCGLALPTWMSLASGAAEGDGRRVTARALGCRA